jgi:hypothetical protein
MTENENEIKDNGQVPSEELLGEEGKPFKFPWWLRWGAVVILGLVLLASLTLYVLFLFGVASPSFLLMNLPNH